MTWAMSPQPITPTLRRPPIQLTHRQLGLERSTDGTQKPGRVATRRVGGRSPRAPPAELDPQRLTPRPPLQPSRDPRGQEVQRPARELGLRLADSGEIDASEARHHDVVETNH